MLKMGKMQGRRRFLRRECIETYMTVAKNKSDEAHCSFSAYWLKVIRRPS